MYSEIAEYDGGSFGDPIGGLSSNPWELLHSQDLTDFEHRGVRVAVLVILMTAIDNATHEDTIASHWGQLAQQALESDVAKYCPLFQAALQSFFHSEAAFSRALAPIYSGWIVPALRE